MKKKYIAFKKPVFLIFLLTLILMTFNCQKQYQKDYESGYEYLSKGEIKDLEKAIDKFNQSITYTIMALDGKTEALKALGHKLSQAKMYLKAAEAFEQAKKIQPTDVTIYYYMGLCYANYAQIQEGKNEKRKYISLAENTYLSGEKINPKDESILYALGVLYGFFKKEPKLGIKYLKKSILIKPKNVKVLFALANLHYQIGNIKPAQDFYLEILNHVKKDSDYALKVKKNLEIIKRKYQVY